MKVMVDPIVIGALGTTPKGVLRGNEKVENWRTIRNYPNYCIVKGGQSAEKCAADLRRLAVTQIPVKDDQLTRV